MSRYFDEEPLLKKRRPKDTRPRRECPLCFERAIVVALLPDGGEYIHCPECDWIGDNVIGPLFLETA